MVEWQVEVRPVSRAARNTTQRNPLSSKLVAGAGGGDRALQPFAYALSTNTRALASALKRSATADSQTAHPHTAAPNRAALYLVIVIAADSDALVCVREVQATSSDEAATIAERMDAGLSRGREYAAHRVEAGSPYDRARQEARQRSRQPEACDDCQRCYGPSAPPCRH